MEYGVWILIGVVIVAVVFVMKIVNKKQAIAVKLTLFLFVAFLLSAGYVYTFSGAEINSAEDVFHLGDVYVSWLFSLFGNAKELTANVINQDWMPGNQTR